MTANSLQWYYIILSFFCSCCFIYSGYQILDSRAVRPVINTQGKRGHFHLANALARGYFFRVPRTTKKVTTLILCNQPKWLKMLIRRSAR
jgi:hypothetical protein